MKKVLYYNFWLITLLIGISSCSQNDPTPSFSQEKDFITPFEGITFFNNNKKADEFLWDLGNGQTSTDENPATHYRSPGIYIVKQKAYTSRKKFIESTGKVVV